MVVCGGGKRLRLGTDVTSDEHGVDHAVHQALAIQTTTWEGHEDATGIEVGAHGSASRISCVR